MDNEILENEEEEETGILTLTDENGVETDFEYLDCIPYEGKEYLLLLPADEAATDVVILEVEPVDEETENYISVQDEAILNAVYDIFKEKYKDVLTFEDYEPSAPGICVANATEIPGVFIIQWAHAAGAFPADGRRKKHEETHKRSLPAGNACLSGRLRRACRGNHGTYGLPRHRSRHRSPYGNHRSPYRGSCPRAAGRYDRPHRHRHGEAL